MVEADIDNEKKEETVWILAELHINKDTGEIIEVKNIGQLNQSESCIFSSVTAKYTT